jgi:UDP-N-acetylglucosamine 2-epimerase
MKKKILTILGTRPELIKMFPIIDKLDKSFYNKLVWSGQHYDFSMVKQNFIDLKVRKPNIEVKIDKKKNVFFQIQKKIYDVILKEKPHAIVYHGDTYTTLATSLVINYFFPKIKRIHIEGGYRSGDITQIEEKCRTISDYLSNIIFVTRDEERSNLVKENNRSKIFTVGNTIFDSVNIIKKRINNDIKKYDLQNIPKKFIYTTIHRAENVDNTIRLKKIVKIINFLSKNNEIIFPIHPRTKKCLKKNKFLFNKNVKLIDPVRYTQSINLISKSLFCFTDSGGIQEEAIILKKRCLIPSNKTPHSFYLNRKANQLVDLRSKNFINKTKLFQKSIFKKEFKKFSHKKNTSDLVIKTIKKYI